jgi:hypothetical protein
MDTHAEIRDFVKSVMSGHGLDPQDMRVRQMAISCVNGILGAIRNGDLPISLVTPSSTPSPSEPETSKSSAS